MDLSIYDIVIAAILLISLVMGYRRGFVLTLCSFLAVFVALVGAMFLSDALAQPVMELISPLIESGLKAYLTQIVPDGSGALESMELPALLAALQNSAFYRGFISALQELLSTQAAATTAVVITAIAEHIALKLAQVVLFVISFVLVLVAWTLLSRALDLAFRLPVLNALNRWTGAAVGLLKGALLLFIAAWLLKDSFLTPEMIEGSKLLHFFCTTNPLDYIR